MRWKQEEYKSCASSPSSRSDALYSQSKRGYTMRPGSISAKYAIPILIVYSTSAVANTDFEECFQQLQQGTWGLQGAVDFSGNPITSLEQATGLTYHACINACGPGSEPFDWVVFSQKFTAWVLPYLALISQLPYIASDRLSNFEVIIMSVGSPMLAAYSLILAVTSNRWMVRRLGRSKHSGAYFAAVVLGGLQQVSLHLAGDELPSLVMLKENDKFWSTLARGLEYSTTRWNLPAIFSMLIVAISYVFTWIDTVRCNLNNEGTCSGESVGSLWMCLIPIVLCNLQLSPKTDSKRILKAFTNAQTQFPVATDGFAQPCPPLVITDRPNPVDEDVVCSSPVCYYARIFQWFKVAGKITDAFEDSLPLVSEMDNQLPMTRMTRSNHVEPEHRALLRDHADRKRDERWDLFLIILRSVILAVLLQWGTIGAAILSHYLTPTIGLSCWSGSYLLYATLATVVWLLAFVSSIFAHIYSTSKSSRSKSSRSLMALVRVLAITLRIAAKIIAGVNAAWVFVFTILQFTNTYNTCYCNSSTLGLCTKAYVILTFSATQMATVISYWTAGMLMAACTAFVFVIAFNILKQAPEMPLNSESLGQDQEEQTPDGTHP